MPIWTRFALLPVLALAACVDPAPPRVAATAGPECGGPDQPTCQFFEGPFQLSNQPVQVPTRAATFYPLARPLGFVDSGNGRWRAPQGTLTDGASIPGIFVAVLGSPRSREFANAAALHDAYCGIGNERLATYHTRDWQAVHRMFYDGLRVGGTDEVRAKIMFAAVWLGGPRWGDKGRDLSKAGVALAFAANGGRGAAPGLEDALRDRVAPFVGEVPGGGLGFTEGPFGFVSYGPDERDLSGVPVHEMRRLLRDAARYIQTTQPTPSLDQIIAFLEAREARLFARLTAGSSGDDASPDPGFRPDEQDLEGDDDDVPFDPTQL